MALVLVIHSGKDKGEETRVRRVGNNLFELCLYHVICKGSATQRHTNPLRVRLAMPVDMSAPDADDDTEAVLHAPEEPRPSWVKLFPPPLPYKLELKLPSAACSESQ